MTNPVTKPCGSCKEDKPLADFPKYSRHLDGLSDECRACHKIARGARKLTIVLNPLDNPQEFLEAQAEEARKKFEATVPFDPDAARKAKLAKLAKQARDRRAAKKAAKS